MNLSFPPAVRVRALPFVAFMLLLWARAEAQGHDGLCLDARWIYGLGVAVVGAMLFAWRREYPELALHRLPGPGEATLSVGIGLIVFVLWIHLDAPWMTIGHAAASFVPERADGTLDVALVIVRACGATLLVPVMEELFWRSLLMRWIRSPDFLAVDPMRVGWRAAAYSTALFVLVHPQWLAAAIAGFAYAGLYMRSGRLWSAVIAHAVTNGALALWVVAGRHWAFW